MSQSRSLTSIWITIGFVAVTLFALVLGGNLLLIGARLGAVHPWLEIAFYILVAALAYWFVCRPVLEVLFTPAVGLEAMASEKNSIPYRHCQKVARQLLKRGNLDYEERAALAEALVARRRLREPLGEIIAKRKGTSTELIRQKAVLAFLATAISQSGRLDAVSLLAINVQLV